MKAVICYHLSLGYQQHRKSLGNTTLVHCENTQRACSPLSYDQIKDATNPHNIVRNTSITLFSRIIF